MKRRFEILILLGVLAGIGGCDILRAFVPSDAKETVAPALPDDLDRPALLLFTKTNGFRHVDGIEGGVAFYERLAKEQGWSLFHTESGAIFNAQDLARFDATLWLNTTGDTLTDLQKQDFRAWLEAGGGFVGSHAAGDGSHTWPWYREAIIGVDYNQHILGPQFQEARLVVEDASHPAMQGIPSEWLHTEEWYSFTESPRPIPGVSVLAHVDESTYSPQIDFLWFDRDIAMGDHPAVWTRCVGRGRIFYSILGHRREAFEDETHTLMLAGAVRWATGQTGSGCR
jgi:type 1 glutamine amidotransferase